MMSHRHPVRRMETHRCDLFAMTMTMTTTQSQPHRHHGEKKKWVTMNHYHVVVCGGIQTHHDE